MEKSKRKATKTIRGPGSVTMTRRNKMRMCFVQRLAKLQLGCRDQSTTRDLCYT